MKSWWDFMPKFWQEFFDRTEQEEIEAKPRAVPFPNAARGRHGLILGGTGAGKSRFFEWLFVVDVVLRLTGRVHRGVLAFDVHGDLYNNLRARLALIARPYPQIEGILCLIDPTIEGWSVRFNPLELRPGEKPELRADRLASVVTAIFQDDPTVVTRMRWLLWHAFLTLILAELPLTRFLDLVRDREFREALVAQLNHPELTSYWLDEFPKSHREAMSWAESSLDRLGRFVVNPYIRPMLEGPSTIDFRTLMDSAAIVLVNAPKGIIGEDASYLLCAFIMAEIFQAALSRVDISEQKRTPFTVLADEFANYATDTVRQILAEARKLGLELLLAGQELTQLKTEALRSTVLNSIGNIFSLRIGYADAEILVKALFTPDIDQVKHSQVKPANWGGVIVPYTDYTWRTLSEIWELEIRNLTELPDRTLWWKRKGHPGSLRIETGTVKNLKDLPDFDQLPETLDRQERAAFRLAGMPNQPGLITVHVDVGNSLGKGSRNGSAPIIYLPPPSDDGKHPRWSA